MPTLSVCTICQDEAEVIGWTMECCVHLKEVLGDDLKDVTVIDGGSKDNTLDVLRKYQTLLPLEIVSYPFDSFGSQKNRAMSYAKGNWIFCPDTDMTWTTNFPYLFKGRYFESRPLWDFPIIFTADNGEYYFHKWPTNYNNRLWRSDIRLETEYHEKILSLGAPGTCGEVVLFENSIRQSDKALMNRGERYQKFAPQMIAAGGGPGPADRYLRAKLDAKPEDKMLIPEQIRKLILPTTLGEPK